MRADHVISPPVTVDVLDAKGNLVTDEPVDVTLSLSGGDPGATLGGTKTQTSVNGVAIFDDLFVRKAGSGYQLTASGGGLQTDTSAAFAVSAADPARSSCSRRSR